MKGNRNTSQFPTPTKIVTCLTELTVADMYRRTNSISVKCPLELQFYSALITSLESSMASIASSIAIINDTDMVVPPYKVYTACVLMIHGHRLGGDFYFIHKYY